MFKETINEAIDNVILENVGSNINNPAFIESLEHRLLDLVNNGTIDKFTINGGNSLIVRVTKGNVTEIFERDEDGGVV